MSWYFQKGTTHKLLLSSYPIIVCTTTDSMPLSTSADAAIEAAAETAVDAAVAVEAVAALTDDPSSRTQLLLLLCAQLLFNIFPEAECTRHMNVEAAVEAVAALTDDPSPRTQLLLLLCAQLLFNIFPETECTRHMNVEGPVYNRETKLDNIFTTPLHW